MTDIGGRVLLGCHLGAVPCKQKSGPCREGLARGLPRERLEN